jgi:hypothetical protein
MKQTTLSVQQRRRCTSFLEHPIKAHLLIPKPYVLDITIEMSCSSEGTSGDGPETTKFQRLKAHAKEFIEASPEEHKQ